MNERKNLPGKILAQDVVVTPTQRGSLVGRGLTALRKDNDELYRQARLVFDQQGMTWHEPYLKGSYFPAIAPTFNVLKQLAKEGFGKAYYPLAILYLGKRGIEKNLELARNFKELAFKWCSANQASRDPEIWLDLGNIYANFSGKKENDVQAVEWYQLAAEQGNILAQSELGYMYYRGFGVTSSVETGLKWMSLAATQGHAVSQFQLGVLCGTGFPDGREQLKWIRLAADQGLREAIWILGQKYRDGDDEMGASQNPEEAVKWFRMGAEKGCARSFADLYDMYEIEAAIAPINEETVSWLRKCAEQGNTEAQWRLGEMYMQGLGVPENDEEGVKLYRMAAEQGNPNAQRALGYAYREGWGNLIQSYEMAGKWFLLAIEQGDQPSKYALSQMWKKGQGILQDYEEVVKREAERQAESHAAVSGFSKTINKLMMTKKLAAMGDADAQKYMQKFNIDWNE